MISIKIGNKIKLLNHYGISEVEGYDEGKEYVVDDIRIMNNDTQIFLAGNIHAYFLENFDQELYDQIMEEKRQSEIIKLKKEISDKKKRLKELKK